jgi:hypothetical protein
MGDFTCIGARRHFDSRRCCEFKMLKSVDFIGVIEMYRVCYIQIGWSMRVLTAACYHVRDLPNVRLVASRLFNGARSAAVAT